MSGRRRPGPASGRARLSYEMAEQLFKRYSGGKTLHQLRHSRLTHLGEAQRRRPLLMAISGHKRLTTLQRYVQAQPGRRHRPDGRAVRAGVLLRA